MNVGGMTVRIFAAAQICSSGRIRGGLGHVNVIGSMIFAGMSGSAVADAAGLGVIEIKAMSEAGYTARFAATITRRLVDHRADHPAEHPVRHLRQPRQRLGRRAVPGRHRSGPADGRVGLMVVIALLAKRQETCRVGRLPPLRRGPTRSSPARCRPLLMPPLILGGIFTGIATPTEAAVIAAAYAFVLGRFVYRELTLCRSAGDPCGKPAGRPRR